MISKIIIKSTLSENWDGPHLTGHKLWTSIFHSKVRYF
jgi:hypothetical protein